MSVVIVDEELRATPGAAAALEWLERAGHEVVDRRDAPDGSIAGLTAPLRDGRPRAWHLTASPEACVEREAGVTTILIGPRRTTERGPTRRCDLEARDLGAAVLEILAREAMPEPPPTRDRRPR